MRVLLHRTATPQRRAVDTGFVLQNWHVAGRRSSAISGGVYAVNSPEAMATLREVGHELGTRLGPAFRFTDEPIGNDGRRLTLAGPDAVSTRTDLLVEAANGVHDRIVAMRAIEAATAEARSATDPDAVRAAEQRRVSAQSALDAAEARIESAVAGARIETRIIAMNHASGPDVAAAMKSALPWATFTPVDGRQVVAAGTAAELEQAIKIAQAVDRNASDHRLRQRMIERSTPSGRFRHEPIDIAFDGGSLDSFLTELEWSTGFQSWLIENPELRGAELPPIRLVRVTGDSALRAISGLPVRLTRDGANYSARLDVDQVSTSDDADDEAHPIYRIRSDTPVPLTPPFPATAAPEPVMRVFKLRTPPGADEQPDLMERHHQPLLGAIEAALEMRGGTPSVTIRLHAASGLLFVRGLPSELTLIHEIIAQWQSTS